MMKAFESFRRKELARGGLGCEGLRWVSSAELSPTVERGADRRAGGRDRQADPDHAEGQAQQ